MLVHLLLVNLLTISLRQGTPHETSTEWVLCTYYRSFPCTTPGALFRKSLSNNIAVLNNAPGVVYGKQQYHVLFFFFFCYFHVVGKGRPLLSPKIEAISDYTNRVIFVAGLTLFVTGSFKFDWKFQEALFKSLTLQFWVEMQMRQKNTIVFSTP